MTVEIEEEIGLQYPIFKLSRDIRQASRLLRRADARWMVDRYYEIQEDRKRAANQLRASEETGEPSQLIAWTAKAIRRYEAIQKSILGEFASSYRVGQWLQAQYGIGPVLSAGLLVGFDIAKAPTVGHFWRFAGLDPTLKWLGKKAKQIVDEVSETELTPQEQFAKLSEISGQHVRNIERAFNDGFKPLKGQLKKGRQGLIVWLARRPWNAKLKALCVFRMGETLIKFCNHPECYYGGLYSQKKLVLTEQNERKEFAEQAEALRDTVGKTTEAYGHYSDGRLPPAQIHARARRWMVKLLISHLHHQMHIDFFQRDPPAPYIFDHPNGSDHRHLLLPPGPSLYDFEGRRLTELK